MNERQLTGSEKARANDRFWVSSAAEQGGCSRPKSVIRGAIPPAASLSFIRLEAGLVPTRLRLPVSMAAGHP